MTRRLWKFHGGLKLAGHKDISTQQAVVEMPLVDEYIIPLSQHIGQPAEPQVEVGDKVLKGQVLALAQGKVSAMVHAPTSGEIIALEDNSVPHPSGQPAPCFRLKADGKDQWLAERVHYPDYQQQDGATLLAQIEQSGIVGLGGAGFPTAVKLSTGAYPVHTLIINGAECEPYISCDDMLMREQADEILQGVLIISHILGNERVLVGIEDNKPQAIAAMRMARDTIAASKPELQIEIVTVPTIYPTGGEKQLIKVLTGKEVPSGGLPLQLGLVCHNVGTAHAVARAVLHGEPLIERLVTVTGSEVSQPGNLRVRLGTPIEKILQHCQVDSVQAPLMGGPMMGFAVAPQAPLIKTSNCLLLNRAEPIPAASPCIRCGQCADVCPALLLPQQLYWHSRSRNFDKAQDYHLFDCIECGCCASVCPSSIPLVDFYRFAKTEIWAKEEEKKQADIARQRHEFREFRQQREKEERAARHAKKKAEVKPDEGDDKQAAIKAAMERVAAKKAQAQTQPGNQPKNTENLTEAQQREIDEIEARRRQQKDKEETNNE